MKHTSTQIERTSRSIVHCTAQCRNCGWFEDAYTKAARAASAHVRKTGHEVGVDQGIVYTVRARSRAKGGTRAMKQLNSQLLKDTLDLVTSYGDDGGASGKNPDALFRLRDNIRRLADGAAIREHCIAEYGPEAVSEGLRLLDLLVACCGTNERAGE